MLKHKKTNETWSYFKPYKLIAAQIHIIVKQFFILIALMNINSTASTLVLKFPRCWFWFFYIERISVPKMCQVFLTLYFFGFFLWRKMGWTITISFVNYYHSNHTLDIIIIHNLTTIVIIKGLNRRCNFCLWLYK